jgi:predicted DNA-binding transcriptional regulator AlpA
MSSSNPISDREQARREKQRRSPPRSRRPLLLNEAASSDPPVTQLHHPVSAGALKKVSAATPPAGEVRLLSKAEVVERVGRTFPTIWLWMQQSKFPRARDLGGRPAWLEHEINDWIERLPLRRLKGDDNAL